MSNLTNRKSWSLQEDQMIKNLVTLYGIQDWTQISNKLKEQYKQSTRSGKQCRQRWYNHLSPDISKNPWTMEQQNKLFRLHRQVGNKWKDISKEFIGRTDNDLKNHFYSTLRKSLRRLNKSLGQKNSTSQMRQIKPSVLSTIMNFIYGQQTEQQIINCLKDVPSLIFEFANIKPTKSILSLKDDQMRDKVMRIFDLITLFNQQYEKSKIKRKEKNNGKKDKHNIKLINKNIKQISLNKQFNIKSQSSNLEQTNIMNNQILLQQCEIKNDNTQISVSYSYSSSSCENYSMNSYSSQQIQQQQQQHQQNQQQQHSHSQQQQHLHYHNHINTNINSHYDFMGIPSGIFYEHDEIMSEFNDNIHENMNQLNNNCQQQHNISHNDGIFDQMIIGRGLFHNNQHSYNKNSIIEDNKNYQNGIVDELLDQ